MVRHFRAAKVYQTAKKNLASEILPGSRPHMPAWLPAVEAIPPSETLTRPYAVQHQEPKPRQRRPHNLYRPRQIVYEEDSLRRTFFRDHPWELARPRVVLELDGKDARYLDWGKGLRQPGLPLCGECVVQRQMWLMHNDTELTKEQAYDIARREFYRLRREEDIERRVAREEARMVGAYFGKSALQVGMELEDEQYEIWKKWAASEIAKIEADKTSAYTSFGSEPVEPDLAADVEGNAVI